MTTLRILLPVLAGHVLLGVALALLIWVAGAGWYAQLRGLRPQEERRGDLVLAYPLGLLLTVGAAFAYLVAPLAGVAVAVVALAPLARASGRAAVVALGKVCAAPVLAAAPFAALFGVVLGVYDHGPSARLDSHAFGDLVFWVARATSMRLDPVHVTDLVTAGSAVPQHEAAPAALDAAFVGALHADPFLVYATALPVLALLSLVVCFALLGRPATLVAATVLGLVAAGSIAYPSWLAESPPVGLALPLAFVLLHLARVRVRLGTLAAYVVLVGLALAVTKPLGAVCLLGWIPVALRGQIRTARPARLALALALPLAVGALIVLLTATASENAFAALTPRCFPCRALGDARTLAHVRSTTKAAGIFELVGQLLLVAALVRARRLAALLPVGAGLLAFWFVGGKGFGIAAALAGLIAAGTLLLDGEERRPSALLLGAGGALAVGAACHDTAQIGAALALVIAATAALAVTPRLLLPVGLVTAAATALVLVGEQGLGRYDMTVLPRDDFLVWRQVRRLTPPDALVFTTQTGSDPSSEAGWNYYPALGERQVYVAGWIYSGLAGSHSTLISRLSANREIFLGVRSPVQIPLARGHSAYYAVMWTNEPHPRSFKELYANHLFVLYRVPAHHPSPVLVMRFKCPNYDTCVPLPKAIVLSSNKS